MKKLMHIIATPRGDESRTLKVSKEFLDAFMDKYPACKIDTIELFKEALPELTAKRVDGKYVLLGGKDLSGGLKEAWSDIVGHIERFLSADGYLLSAPMWNFSSPYRLKHYIDVIFQPRYLFQYAAGGVEGLVKGKKMLIVSGRGGDYSSEAMKPLDRQEPHLRAAFGFIGITDLEFLKVQPMDALGPKVAQEKIRQAQLAARSLAKTF